MRTEPYEYIPPLVSVVIPTYNYARFIGEAIKSVLAQSCRADEIVVVDDGSSDDTKSVVARFAEVRYLYQVNQGIAAARNAGLRASRGKYLVFLDADDCLLPDCLATSINCLENNAQLGFVSGQWEKIDAHGKALPPIAPILVKQNHYRAFLDFNYMGTMGQVMFRRSVLEAVNEFDALVPGCDDMEMYLRISRIYPVECHDKVVVQKRTHGSNTSGNRKMMLTSMLKVYRAQWKYVKDDSDLERLCRQGIELCEKFLAKERKRVNRERYKSIPLVKHALNLRHRIRAELIFRRYKRMRRRSKERNSSVEA